MINDFEMDRAERRSFSCPNKLWYELSNKCGDIISISTFIKQAILEKLVKEEPKKRKYFEELI